MRGVSPHAGATCTQMGLAFDFYVKLLPTQIVMDLAQRHSRKGETLLNNNPQYLILEIKCY